jgi:hypothetical protein
MGHPAEFARSQFSIGSTETLMGRSTHKVDETFGYNSPPDAPIGVHTTHRTLWIDNEVGIPIAAEALNDLGFITDSWAFTSLEINPFIDASVFAYLPPTNTSVYLEGLTEIWTRIAHNASFTVFVPGGNTPANIHIASTLMPEYPAYNRNDQVLKQTYLSRADPTKLSIVLSITEQPALGTPSASYQYQEANGLRTLEFDRGGTHISLEGRDEVTKQDLYDIADKLQPLT